MTSICVIYDKSLFYAKNNINRNQRKKTQRTSPTYRQLYEKWYQVICFNNKVSANIELSHSTTFAENSYRNSRL